MIINISLNTNIQVELNQLNLKEIIKIILIQCHKIFFLLIQHLDLYITDMIKIGQINIKCPVCKKELFYKKGFRKDARKIKSSIGKLTFTPLRMLRCKYLSPILLILGIKRYQRVADELKLKGVFSALHTTYRLAKSVLNKALQVSISPMTIWREVQRIGKKIDFEVLKDKELKLFAQVKRNGSIRLVGLGIGPYKTGWEFMKKSLESINEKFRFALFITDESIIKVIRKYVRFAYFQRCSLNVYYEHVLWEEGKRRTDAVYIECLTFSIIKFRKGLKKEEVKEEIVEEKKKRFSELIDWAKENGLKKVSSYLARAEGYIFTVFSKNLPTRRLIKANSLIERVMREINFRVEVASNWSDEGVLNIVKLRLGVIYNNLELEEIEMQGKRGGPREAEDYKGLELRRREQNRIN